MARTANFVEAFGWRIARCAMEEGDAYNLMVVRDMARSDIGAVTLYTKGEVEVVRRSDGAALAPRVAGLFTPTLGPIAKGRYSVTAKQDAEWWCADLKSNLGGDLSRIGFENLPAGGAAAGKVLVCTGPDAGTSHLNGYTAQAACFVLTFNGSRA